MLALAHRLRWVFSCPTAGAGAGQRAGVSVTTTAIAGRIRDPQSVGQFQADAACNFRSLLFPGSEPPLDEAVETPSFFADLNLDQIVDAVIAGREEYALKPFFHIPLRDVDAIAYRHEIVRDLDNAVVAGAVRLFAQRFRELRQHLALVEHLHYKPNRQGWFLHATTIYCGAVESLKDDLYRAAITSRGLVGFRDYLSKYTASDYFTAMATQAKRIKTNLSSICYSVVISGLTVRVGKYEGEVDYSTDVAQCFDKFRERAATDYRVKFSERSETDHVEGQILEFVARLYPEIFSELDDFYTANADFQDQAIRNFDREAQFYLAYLEYIGRLKAAGLQFCYPRITDKGKAVHVREGFDLALAAKLVPENSPVVCNDFHCRSQVSAAGTGGGLPDGVDDGAQAAPRAERGPDPPAARFSRSGRDLHRRSRRSGQSRPQHQEPRQEPGCRRRREGAGTEEPQGKARARREAPTRVLCWRRPHRRSPGRHRCRTRCLPQSQCRGQFASADRRVCRLSRP